MVKKIFRKNRNRRSRTKVKKTGHPPGTLLFTGEEEKEETKIRIIDFDEKEYKIMKPDTIEQIASDIDKKFIRWIDITGFKDIKKFEQLGNLFNLHPLTLEDILNIDQRPKFEDYGNYVFIVLKKMNWDENENEVKTEQVSIILGSSYVISIMAEESNIFEPIVDRIKIPKGRVRYMGEDYLMYALIDIIIDDIFELQDTIGDFIEDIEDKLIEDPEFETLQSIYRMRRTIGELKKTIWPIREVISQIQRNNSEFIKDDLNIFLRDVYDHIYRINDTFQNYRDIISGMLDMYLSSVSNKMNDINIINTIEKILKKLNNH
ncbi:MAG: magnesium and cobalt transport protein CorA [Candidatus Lokiarchaeota archaeon]